MLNIIDMINDSNILTEDSVLVSFDIVKMFPSIDNFSGLEAVSEILENRETELPPVECILEALKLYLECNKSLFHDKFYLQEDVTMSNLLTVSHMFSHRLDIPKRAVTGS